MGQRVAGPHITDVIDAGVRMFEQVRGRGVDLERVFLIQQVQIEPLTAHLMIVLQTTTGQPADLNASKLMHDMQS